MAMLISSAVTSKVAYHKQAVISFQSALISAVFGKLSSAVISSVMGKMSSSVIACYMQAVINKLSYQLSWESCHKLSKAVISGHKTKQRQNREKFRLDHEK